MSKNRRHILCITITGIMSALAAVLLFLVPEIPVSLGVNHLRLEFSNIPALFATFICGPWYGVAVVFIKSVLQLFATANPTFGIGEFINFSLGTVLVLTMWFVPRLISREKQYHEIGPHAYYIGAGAAAVMTIIIGLLLNMALLPLFFKLMSLSMTPAVWWTTAIASLPLNIVKPLATTLPLYPVILLLRKVAPDML